MDDSAHGFFHWNELLTTDVEKAKAFYAQTLGWSYDEMPMPDGNTYFVAIKEDEPIGGLMKMPAAVPAGTPPHWLSYIEVDDIDEQLAKTQQAGGTVLRPAFEVPEVGRIAVIGDPTGAVVGLIMPTQYEGDA